MKTLLTALALFLTSTAFGASLRLSDYTRTNQAVAAALMEISAPSGLTNTTRAVSVGCLFSNQNLGGITTITNLAQFTNSNVLWVRPEGNDNTAIRGRWDKPWLSVSNALAAAQMGDVVQLGAGWFTNKSFFMKSNTTAGIPFNGGVIFNSKTNVTLRGLGAKSSVLNFTNIGDGIYATNCSGITIEDLTVKGTMAAYPISAGYGVTFAGIHLQKCLNVTIQNCWIIDHTDHGVAYLGANSAESAEYVTVRGNCFTNIGSYNTLGNSDYDGTAIVPTKNWLVEDNIIYDVGRAVEPYPADYEGDNIIIRRNRIGGYLDFGISDGGTGSNQNYDMEISDNFIELVTGYTRNNVETPNSGATPILIEKNQRTVIRNNTIHASGDQTTGAGIIIRGTATGRQLVQGNTVNGFKHGIVVGPNVLFTNVSLPSDVWLIGNTVQRSLSHGIMFCATNGAIVGNLVECIGQTGGGSTYAGIVLTNSSRYANNSTYGQATNITVANNVILDFQPTCTLTYGVWIREGISNTVASGNIVRGANLFPYWNDTVGQTTFNTFYGASNSPVLTVLGSTNQATNMIEVRSSTNTVLAKISNTGAIHSSGFGIQGDSNGWAYAGNTHRLVSGSYGVGHHQDGTLDLNAITSKYIRFKVNDAIIAGFNPNGYLWLNSSDDAPANTKLWVKGNSASSLTNFAAHAVLTNGFAVGASGGTITNILTASATLDFGSTDPGTDQDLAITVSGCSSNDVVTLGVPNSVVPAGGAAGAGGIYSAYTSNGVVFVRFTNPRIDGGGGLDPAAGVFKVMVTRW